ncbi:MAG: type II secretion system protein [Legionella sp.]|nr:type II secretion system protein [Legionella sp.]
MTLILISIISVLISSNLQHILLYYKAIHTMELQHAQVFQMEVLASQLVRNSNVSSHCILQWDDANQAIQSLMNNKGCILVVGSRRFQYLLEDLGDFACLIVKSDNAKLSTNHRRLTLMLASEDKSKSNPIIQIRDIRAIAYQKCMVKESPISLGISSWRLLS